MCILEDPVTVKRFKSRMAEKHRDLPNVHVSKKS